jgi:uncharacterized repeat protein (TIGR01451 family)
LVAIDAPVTQMGDYHLATGSPAINTGFPLPGGTPNPATLAHDVDLQSRANPVDKGADEFSPTNANLGVTKTDGLTTVTRGQAIQYTIVASNAGPSGVIGASVADTVPAQLTGVTWTCLASTGSSCPASGTGSIAATVNLANLGTATFTVNATVSATAVGTIANTVTISGSNDPLPGNNSWTDSDTISLPPRALPALGLLDNFTRAGAALNLGGNWSQSTFFGLANILPTAGQALSLSDSIAVWNVPAAGFGSQQGAAFAFANTPVDGASLLLKASGGTATNPASYIRVRYTTASGGQVIIETTTNSGTNFTPQTTFNGAFANGNVLSAVVLTNGDVYVYRTAGAVTTQLGGAPIGAAGTGTGRIGIRLPATARVDNFSGGIAP